MIKINLNKGKRQKKIKMTGLMAVRALKVEKKHIAIYIILPILLGFGIVYLMQTYIGSQITNVKNETAAYNTKISLIMPKVQKVMAIKKIQSDILQKINVIKTLKKEQKGPIGSIVYIVSAVPRFAWISSLKSTNGQINISGIALDGQVVSIFMNNLSKTGFFNSINLTQTTEVKKQGLKLQNFNLTMNKR
jgi:Tfp pilus assembly protein PilN